MSKTKAPGAANWEMNTAPAQGPYYGSGRDFFYRHETIAVSVELEVKKPDKDLFIGIEVWDKNQLLASSYTYDQDMQYQKGIRP